LALVALVAHGALLAWWATAGVPSRGPLWASLGLLAATAIGLLTALRHQHRLVQRLLCQLREQEPLALGAEPLQQPAPLTDGQRRVVWTTEAFARHSGDEPCERQGRDASVPLHAGPDAPPTVPPPLPAAAAEWLRVPEAADGADAEFQLAYQPLVALASRRLVGVEALLRWRHPGRAEPSAVDLLDAACEAFAQWQVNWGEHAPRLLVLNLTPEQLQPELLPALQALLQTHGLRPAQLQLAIGEAVLGDEARAGALLPVLQAFKAAGLRLALAEVGSGGASLAALHGLPLDVVTVAPALVAGAAEVEYQRVRVAATIRVARSLGMTSAADGVATEDQAALLARLGCDQAQGALFGRPMTAAALDRWIEAEVADTVA